MKGRHSAVNLIMCSSRTISEPRHASSPCSPMMSCRLNPKTNLLMYPACRLHNSAPTETLNVRFARRYGLVIVEPEVIHQPVLGLGRGGPGSIMFLVQNSTARSCIPKLLVSASKPWFGMGEHKQIHIVVKVPLPRSPCLRILRAGFGWGGAHKPIPNFMANCWPDSKSSCKQDSTARGCTHAPMHSCAYAPVHPCTRAVWPAPRGQGVLCDAERSVCRGGRCESRVVSAWHICEGPGLKVSLLARFLMA